MNSSTLHQLSNCEKFSRFFFRIGIHHTVAMNIFRDLSFLVCVLRLVNCLILETKQGSLKGETLLSRGGRPYYAFYSVPYAEPPVGELRFQSPVPPSKWQGVKDATVLPPPCACMSAEDDITIVGEEDCLYLNVYTPKVGNNTLLPVMVFIFGGRYMYGNALPSRYGPQYFMDEDVVLITFHYRLGVLGFLSTEDEVIPGNYGLKDSIAVLQWVQNYIDSYGARR
ncbi:juvenile hormone esterase-like isoform X1 [Planococcus citri]|uniref:juvenile hormone esterase-like isoform X1 n=1 Tax=Planococcus citri TaxID=170843 RepID=UPI0031F85558